MKHKTASLEGAQLNAAVAKAEGRSFSDGSFDCAGGTVCNWRPSTDWQDGGPIIERERISVSARLPWTWSATAVEVMEHNGRKIELQTWQEGPTPLVAAMRAYVSSKLGDEVEIP